MSSLVVDTSAVVAALTEEPGHRQIKEQLSHVDQRLMSAATLVELGIVIESRYGDAGALLVDRFIRDAAIDVVPLSAEHAQRAREAWRRFGKGRGHPAQLNLSDCYTYALADAENCPILCTGKDFAAAELPVMLPTDEGEH